jgi:outer membrane protein assembly factor BamE (lipoprotein component of BamABCDE complex)
MRTRHAFAAAVAAGALAAAGTACASGYVNHPERLDQVRVGTTTVKQLEAMLGTPLRKPSFPWIGIDAWEYETSAWTRRPVHSFTIGKDGVVRGVVRYTP